MADLEVRLEIDKLRDQLRVDDDRLSFLDGSSVEELRELRQVMGAAIAERNADRVERLASLTKLAPASASAKIAEHAFGPLLSARIAGAVDPDEAVKLASHMPSAFLADVAAALDPARVAPIIRKLPDELLVDLGRRLLDADDHAALGRLVAVVSTDVAARVVEDATGHQLLQVALYADDPTLIESVAERLSDDQLLAVVAAADDFDPEARDLLLGRMSPQTRDRLAALTDGR